MNHLSQKFKGMFSQGRSFKYIFMINHHVVLSILVSFFCANSWGFAQNEPSFDESAQTILRRDCLGCHGVAQMSGLDLRTKEAILKGGSRGPAIVIGQADQSLLFLATDHQSDLKMPPEKPKLSDKDLIILKEWINSGSYWLKDSEFDQNQKEPSWWSFKKPQRYPIPMVNGQEWKGNPIDAFIESKLKAKGLVKAPPAERLILIRRAYFDLIGLPPSPEKIDSFLNDDSPEAFERVVDGLLASPQYGERWARHWLDVVRYADSAGFETDEFFPDAWRYRDYVIKSFNEDKPYDRFLQEQIAADELWPNNLDLEGTAAVSIEKLRQLEARVGTGLYGLVPLTGESKLDVKVELNQVLTDWVDTTASAFMGLTLGCARCHDHKFDPLSQRDYYQFQAIFAESQMTEIPVVTKMSMFHRAEFYSNFLTLSELRWAHRKLEQTVSERVFQAKKDEYSEKVVKAYDTPEDDRTPEQERIIRPLLKALKKLGDPVGKTLLNLPEHLNVNEKEYRTELLKQIALSVVRIPTTEPSHQVHFDALFDVPKARVFRNRDPELVPVIYVLERGDLGKNLERVNAGVPRVLANDSNFQKSSISLGLPRSRSKLALWLSQPEHPLTARVMVNRLWQWHFGTGLVSTPNDFGQMGQRPTHPKLLDWLATEFVAGGWSLKSMHRLIMVSNTYQRTSRYSNPKNSTADPSNLYWWRMKRKRLEAEALWDALHSVAGTLTLKIGGRSFCPPVEGQAGKNWVKIPVDLENRDLNRRAIYIMVQRNFGFPMFETFDTPDPAVSCSVREVTTVPPQALFFMNNKMVVSQAKKFAQRLVRESGDDPAAWIRKAWRLALGRDPSQQEKLEAMDLLKSLTQTELGANKADSLAQMGVARAEALSQLCLAIFNLSEFSYVD